MAVKPQERFDGVPLFDTVVELIHFASVSQMVRVTHYVDDDFLRKTTLLGVDCHGLCLDHLEVRIGSIIWHERNVINKPHLLIQKRFNQRQEKS